MWNNPPLGWKIEILTVANHCLCHPLSPLPFLVYCKTVNWQSRMQSINNTAKLFYNEEMRQSKALTNGEIPNIIQIQISILSRCRRPMGSIHQDNLFNLTNMSGLILTLFLIQKTLMWVKYEWLYSSGIDTCAGDRNISPEACASKLWTNSNNRVQEITVRWLNQKYQSVQMGRVCRQT